MRLLTRSAAALLSVGLLLSTAAAQTERAPPRNISRAQAQELITALETRNEQLRSLAARVGELETQLAEARAEAQGARSVLGVAEQKNRELVAIGTEILDAYQNRSLGERVAGGEPLTQLYRVRLENAMQDYASRIAEQRVFAEREIAAARARAAAPAQPAPQQQ